MSQWQNEWNQHTDNKLHSIKPIISDWSPCYRENRRDEVVLARLRMGHTYVTHSCLLKGEDRPWCMACDEPFTVKHFLLDCIDLLPSRDNFYRDVTSLKNLFETIHIYKILDYLKDIGLYNKIWFRYLTCIFYHNYLVFLVLESSFNFYLFYCLSRLVLTICWP